MDNSVAFTVSTIGIVVGLVILLFGVSLNNGQDLNATMAAGGAVIVGGLGILTAGILRLDAAHAEES